MHSECFFTDGSKTPGHEFVGLSSILAPEVQVRRFRAPGFASIFTAEALAIAETLIWISTLEQSSFAIFLDSLSVLRALSSKTNSSKKSYLVGYLKNQLKNLQDNGISVKLYWVPAHVGLAGNELTDTEAKAALRSGRDTQIGLPVTDLMGLWKEKLETKFHEWCRTESDKKGTKFLNTFYRRERSPWYVKHKLTRKTIVSLNHLRSGHTSLRSSLSRFKIVPSGRCPCGESDETPDHVFWQCTRFEPQRKEILDSLVKRNGFLPYSVDLFLHSMEPSALKAIEKFLKKIYIYV